MNDNRPSLIADRTEQLSQVVIATIDKFKTEHFNEKLYAFAFVASPEGDSVHCAFATEEGLTNIAAEYTSRYPSISKDDSLETQRVSLRWLNPDDGWYYYSFGDIFDDFWSKPFAMNDLELFDESTENICVNTLKRLDEMGLFGKDGDRNSIIVGFTYGSDPDDFLHFAKEVNPPTAYNRLCEEIRESCKNNGVESPI
jgi:Domain of unknown function (DUF4303)